VAVQQLLVPKYFRSVWATLSLLTDGPSRLQNPQVSFVFRCVVAEASFEAYWTSSPRTLELPCADDELYEFALFARRTKGRNVDGQ